MARETPSNEHDAGVEPAFEPPSLADEQEAGTAHYPVDRVVFGVAAACGCREPCHRP